MIARTTARSRRPGAGGRWPRHCPPAGFDQPEGSKGVDGADPDQEGDADESADNGDKGRRDQERPGLGALHRVTIEAGLTDGAPPGQDASTVPLRPGRRRARDVAPGASSRRCGIYCDMGQPRGAAKAWKDDRVATTCSSRTRRLPPVLVLQRCWQASSALPSTSVQAARSPGRVGWRRQHGERSQATSTQLSLEFVTCITPGPDRRLSLQRKLVSGTQEPGRRLARGVLRASIVEMMKRRGHRRQHDRL